MPTDGTLLLEYVPKAKQYLVTALSVFFSVGSVISALVALIILPNHSCPNTPSGPTAGVGNLAKVSGTSVPSCDVETQNRGWRYLLTILATLVRII